MTAIAETKAALNMAQRRVDELIGNGESDTEVSAMKALANAEGKVTAFKTALTILNRN